MLDSLQIAKAHTLRVQVEGAKGVGVLAAKVRGGGVHTLWHGALAASSATFVGHYPWYVHLL